MVDNNQKEPNVKKNIKDRELFLKKMYNTSQGNTSIPVSLKKISEEMSLSLDQIIHFFRYFKEKGFLKPYGTEKAVLTQQGIDYYENQVDPHNFSNKYTVFISRINEHKEISKKLKDLLESLFEGKVSVFDADDPICIPFSEDWFTSIKKGIKDCKLMIILCSPLSVQRPWINFEAGAATILERSVGPICFAGQSAGNLPSPLNYIRSQAIDISDNEKFQEYFNSLLDRIAHQMNIEPPVINVLETDFFKLLSNARDGGKPKKPPIFAVRGF